MSVNSKVIFFSVHIYVWCVIHTISSRKLKKFIKFLHNYVWRTKSFKLIKQALTSELTAEFNVNNCICPKGFKMTTLNNQSHCKKIIFCSCIICRKFTYRRIVYYFVCWRCVGGGEMGGCSFPAESVSTIIALNSTYRCVCMKYIQQQQQDRYPV